MESQAKASPKTPDSDMTRSSYGSGEESTSSESESSLKKIENLDRVAESSEYWTERAISREVPTDAKEVKKEAMNSAIKELKSFERKFYKTDSSGSVSSINTTESLLSVGASDTTSGSATSGSSAVTIGSPSVKENPDITSGSSKQGTIDWKSEAAQIATQSDEKGRTGQAGLIAAIKAEDSKKF